MNEGMAIDHFYKHQLNAYLDSEEDKQPIVDYQGETLDAAREIVYRLESSSKLYVFDQDNAVEFLDFLKGQYKDAHQLLKDFGLDIDDLFYAIEDSEFSIDCTIDFLLFLSAEKAEAEWWINKNCQRISVKQQIKSPSFKRKFEDVLGKKAPQFISSLINVVNSNTELKKVDQNSVIAAALVAAALDLPINQNFGYMYLVPYKGKGSYQGKAQPQMGYKGYIQLA